MTDRILYTLAAMMIVTIACSASPLLAMLAVGAVTIPLVACFIPAGYISRARSRILRAATLSLVAFAVIACGGTLQSAAPTIIRGTLGGLYGACQAVDLDDPTWNRICDGVSAALPFSDQLGAGPAELPPDVAAREVTITIGSE